MDRLVTRTLAEIYLQQGHFEEAYSLFKTLSERDPEDVELRDRLKELEEKRRLLAQDAELPGDVERMTCSAPPPTYPDRVGQRHTADSPATLSQSTQSTPRDPRKIHNLEKWLNNIRERRKP